MTPVLFALVALDVADASIRHWFTGHAFTTDSVVAVLVLLITVLNVDRVTGRRRVRERSQVTAAQSAILARQAQRTATLVRGALDDDAQRESASDELRTYMGMLLVSAPILIDAPSARAFLEAAQQLAALLSRALSHADERAQLAPRLDAAEQRVNVTAQPLVAMLDRAQLRAVEPSDDAA